MSKNLQVSFWETQATGEKDTHAWISPDLHLKAQTGFQNFDIVKVIQKGAQEYSLIDYKKDIESVGLRVTWEKICAFVLEGGETPFLQVKAFGALYEYGLANIDKHAKKSKGQYYTPKDVASVMAEWLLPLPGEHICDVACGVGVLILAYLALLGRENARDLITQKRLYLFDNDPVALMICKCSIAFLYGRDLIDKIQVYCVDFLSQAVTLPINAKVISNPPYGKIEKMQNDWQMTQITKNTKEFYACF
ncbi:MAG: SAM-dependent methyltransferase, partial [Firmicutes bacterium]|nr:SAM-dependent methyltransferase [Bacillota bacterium]